MTRHAKNVTAGNVYTVHERKKDAKQSGYGSEAIRLGKDSIKVVPLYKIFTFCLFFVVVSSLQRNTLSLPFMQLWLHVLIFLLIMAGYRIQLFHRFTHCTVIYLYDSLWLLLQFAIYIHTYISFISGNKAHRKREKDREKQNTYTVENKKEYLDLDYSTCDIRVSYLYVV